MLQVAHEPWNPRTEGIVPYLWGDNLLIIDGGVRGHFLPTIYGTAYLYQNFPWPNGEKLTEKECRDMANRISKIRPEPTISDEVAKQFEKILGIKIISN